MYLLMYIHVNTSHEEEKHSCFVLKEQTVSYFESGPSAGFTQRHKSLLWLAQNFSFVERFSAETKECI